MNEQNNAPAKELTKLEKKYKRLRWTQHILFWASLISALLPAITVALNTGLVYDIEQNDAGKWRLAGFATIVLSVGIILVLKGLSEKIRDKMPWAITAAVGSWIMTGFIFAISKIVEDALFISFVLAVGCTVAVVLSSISDLCRARADAMQQEYYRRQE